MSLALKKRCEILLAREFYKIPGLRPITPNIWDSVEKAKQLRLNIQASPAGESLAYPFSIFMVDCQVRVEGKPRKHDVGFYIALVDQVFAGLALLDKSGLEGRFQGTGVYVHGVIPRQMPASIEGSNRVDMAAVALVAHLACG